MRPLWTVLILLIVLLVSPIIVGAQDVQDKKEELNAIKRQIEEKRRKITEASKKETSILTQLSQMDNNLDERQREIVSLAGEIKGTSMDIEQLEKRTSEMSALLGSKQADIKKRIAALYKLGRTGYLPVLFDATGAEDLRRRGKYLAAVISSDHSLFSTYAAEMNALTKDTQELKKKRDALSLLKENADKRTTDLIREKDRRMLYLENIRDMKSSYEQALVELQAAERALTSLIESLQFEKEKREKELVKKDKKNKTSPTNGHTSTPSGGYFAGLKGSLPYPAAGEVITKYGKGKDPKYNNPIYNKGIEIKAPEGSPICAVADGEVIYAEYFPGYGNLIIIDHGDNYYTVYAHAREMLKKVGDKVKAGVKIGTVGDTGSLKGNTLYFEIRHHGDTADPQLWLAAG
jgi:murein hydrolase activator